MIIVTDVIKTTPSGIGKALDFAAKVTEYIKKAGLIPGRYSVLRPYSGTRNGSVIFTARYASLTELNDQDKKCFSDSEYMALIMELRGADWFTGSERNIYTVEQSSD